MVEGPTRLPREDPMVFHDVPPESESGPVFSSEFLRAFRDLQEAGVTEGQIVALVNLATGVWKAAGRMATSFILK